MLLLLERCGGLRDADLGEADPSDKGHGLRERGDLLSLRRRLAPSNPDTCPGIKDLLRPTMNYVKCHSCGGSVEVWSDEDEGECLDCGIKWQKPDGGNSCLEYCEYADKCREIIASPNY